MLMRLKQRRFADFGTPSYYQVGKDCPIGGSWETYCDCMFTPGGNENHLCKSKYCVVFNPFSPGDCSADPRKAAPPWTEVGAAARSIRKPNAGLVYGVTAATNLPGPDAYDPEKLIIIGATDPIRYAFLAGVATYVSATFGAAYMAQFKFPQSVLTGLPLAVGLAIARGGTARAWTNILEPLIDEGGLIGETILNYCLNGNSAIASYAMKKVALKLDGLPKAVVLAIADAAPTVIDAVRDTSKFKESYVYSAIGVGLQKIAKAIDPNSPRGPFVLIGEALDTFSRTISALLKGKPDQAIDEASFAIFGVKWSVLKNLASGDKQKILGMADHSAIDGLGTVADVVGDIAGALSQIGLDKAAVAINEIGSAIGTIISQVSGAASTGGTALPASPNVSSGGASLSPAPNSITYPKLTTAKLPRSLQPGNVAAKPDKSGAMGPALLGAGGGFAVGGPPGAIAGAAIGLLFSLIKNRGS